MSENIPRLNAEIAELRELLRPFAFRHYRDQFQSTDGGCTEVILTDESVQRVRTYFDKHPLPCQDAGRERCDLAANLSSE